MSPRGAATLNSLAGLMDVKKIIWARWRVGDDGQIDVIATYAQDDRYAEWLHPTDRWRTPPRSSGPASATVDVGPGGSP